MPKYFLYASIVLMVISGSGCFPPEPVIKLTLDNPDKVFIMGSEYIKLNSGGIEAIISFVEESDWMLLLDVSIANYTDSVIRIEPEKFYYREEGQSENSERGMKIFAYDPEAKILEFEKRRNKEDAMYASRRFGNATLAVLDFAADISTLGKEKTEEEILDEAIEDEHIARQWEEINIDHERAELILDNGLKQWSIYALRKTDLPPGYAIRGLIYFQRRSFIKRINMFFPVKDEIFQLNFNQQKY